MTPKNPPLLFGLAAPGLLWLATSPVALGQDSPPAPPGPPTKAPASPSPGSKAHRVLLLTNGKVIPGDIVEDVSAGLYRLRQNGGSVTYPRIMVLCAGNSTEDLYRYQVARLPEGDPDERMKLARWCLTEKLAPQAREQLEAIKAMCPGDAEVKRMLYNLAATAERPALLDDGVRRTSGEAPGTLDPRVVTKATKRFNALPEIFDLPPAQAVKRANEFADYVQPVLQLNCAKCHGEKYQGDFQLVEVRTRRDQMNPDIARANLDATLRLINPDDPGRSPLLSAGLVPHGDSKAAIFRGANDKNYQVLSQWTRSLKPGQSAAGASKPAPRGFGEGVSRTGFNPAEEGFASERSARPSTPRSPADPAEPFDTPLPPPPPKAIVERYDESAEFVTSAGDRPEFPAPFSLGGAPVSRPAPPRPKAKAGAKPPTPGTPASPSPAPSVSKRPATPAGPGAVIVTTSDPNELPGMDQPRYPPKVEAADDDEADKKKAKPIDGALLERLMKARNGGTP